MIEYFKNPKSTEEFFHKDSTGEVWSQTGDIGYMNEDGSLVVLGRKSDFSIIDGVKIYNFDIENAVLSSNIVKLCEVQTHPEDSNKIVCHVVWENDIKDAIQKNPELERYYFELIQKSVLDTLQIEQAVPYSFCVRDSFPSAYSGKRDIKFIKGDIEGLIELQKPQVRILK